MSNFNFLKAQPQLEKHNTTHFHFSPFVENINKHDHVQVKEWFSESKQQNPSTSPQWQFSFNNTDRFQPSKFKESKEEKVGYEYPLYINRINRVRIASVPTTTTDKNAETTSDKRRGSI